MIFVPPQLIHFGWNHSTPASLDNSLVVASIFPLTSPFSHFILNLT